MSKKDSLKAEKAQLYLGSWKLYIYTKERGLLYHTEILLCDNTVTYIPVTFKEEEVPLSLF